MLLLDWVWFFMKHSILYLSSLFVVLFLAMFVVLFFDDSEDITIVEVNIKGQVQFPGIYYVKYGSPLAQLLNEAGGVTDLGYIPDDFEYDLLIYTNMTITIPRKYELR